MRVSERLFFVLTCLAALTLGYLALIARPPLALSTALMLALLAFVAYSGFLHERRRARDVEGAKKELSLHSIRRGLLWTVGTKDEVLASFESAFLGGEGRVTVRGVPYSFRLHHPRSDQFVLTAMNEEDSSRLELRAVFGRVLSLTNRFAWHVTDGREELYLRGGSCLFLGGRFELQRGPNVIGSVRNVETFGSAYRIALCEPLPDELLVFIFLLCVTRGHSRAQTG